MTQKVLLGLKLPTDPRWTTLAEGNVAELLSDHAWCEQKAASNAISLMVVYSDIPDLVAEMTRICQEELMHFQMVHEKILQRGWVLGPPRRDEYVSDLSKFILKGGSREQHYVDQMLFAAMIEARSCERFKMLSERMTDPDLKQFYFELMASEADHYSTFIGFARKYNRGVDVDARWQQFLDYEASLMAKYGKRETMHG